jgi:hypothetical protein
MDQTCLLNRVLRLHGSLRSHISNSHGQNVHPSSFGFLKRLELLELTRKKKVWLFQSFRGVRAVVWFVNIGQVASFHALVSDHISTLDQVVNLITDVAVMKARSIEASP